MMPMTRRALVTALAVYLAGSISAGGPLIRGAQAATQATLPSEGFDSGLTNIGATQGLPAASPAGATAAVLTSVDYPPATWTPAAPTNYTVANRPQDYPIDMIVIHDIEGSAASAIKTFQDPKRHASANYVISYTGQVWQMVLETDIAWHAGNWDYNTRAIGIEHEGYAWTPGLYTKAEYRASAHLAASICSRWGVPMDRAHVIGHNQVPDPFHPGLFGGSDHHTDPGPYWNWTTYMSLAQYYASLLPSPPHMMVDPVAVPWDQSATVTWQPAHTCHNPITGYHVVLQPGNIVQDLPGNATTATVGGLVNGTSYSFTVTASNADGQSTLQSNSVIAGPHCTMAGLISTLASPQFLGTQLQLSASSTICPNPHYEFWLQHPNGQWIVGREFGSGTWTWDTALYPPGAYTIRVWANQTGDTGSSEAFADVTFSLIEPPPCTSSSLAPGSPSQPAGSAVTFTASASGCPIPLYEYWVQYPNGAWSMLRTFGTGATWNWNTTGLSPGTYTVHVWANHPGHSTANLEVFASSTVTLTGCTSASLSPAKPSQPAGSTVAFTASSGGCPNPVYEYWVHYPGGTWYMNSAFSSDPTWSWNTSGLRPGIYTVHVWANQQGAYTGALEVIGSGTVTLTTPLPCATAGLTPSNPSQPAGSTVALTPASTSCTSPRYEFWVHYPSGSWYLRRGWGGPTFNLTTAGLKPGTYTVHVWANQLGDSTVSYEAFGSDTVTLTGCTSATLSPASGSSAVGTPVLFTAGSSGCPNPVYEFWLQDTLGKWHLMRGFGANTWNWNTTIWAKGIYHIHAWANQQGAYAGALEAFGSSTYTLT